MKTMMMYFLVLLLFFDVLILSLMIMLIMGNYKIKNIFGEFESLGLGNEMYCKEMYDKILLDPG